MFSALLEKASAREMSEAKCSGLFVWLRAYQLMSYEKFSESESEHVERRSFSWLLSCFVLGRDCGWHESLERSGDANRDVNSDGSGGSRANRFL